jgi:tRNA threonylcarbamoyl adenosine modification protein YeaZ
MIRLVFFTSNKKVKTATKKIMHLYLAIQNTYDIFEMAFFDDNNIIDYLYEDKRHTSKMFIPLLNQLCIKNNIQFSDISFCAVNCGPGPFSTLRSVIASVNGLHLATNVSLIGIDGLDATFLEFYDVHYHNTVVLLNAFNGEVYYLIAQGDRIVTKGYKKIDVLLTEIEQQYFGQSIYFIGNGAVLYNDLIQQICGNNAIVEKNVDMCSLKIIGKLGLQAFLHKQQSSGYLVPLHLKKHPVEM